MVFLGLFQKLHTTLPQTWTCWLHGMKWVRGEVPAVGLALLLTVRRAVSRHPSMSQHPGPSKLSYGRILEFTRAMLCSYWYHQQTVSVTLADAIMCRTHRWHGGGPAGCWAKSRRANALGRGQKKCSQNPQVSLAHCYITTGSEKQDQLTGQHGCN